MKKTIKIFGLAIMVLSLFVTSCAKDGEDGAMGPAGIDGIDGIDGTNGVDGTNGEDGVDGADGADGNANVTSQNFDISDHSGTSYQLGTTLLTADNVENGVILAYLRINNEWYQIPNQKILTNGLSLIDISSYFSPIGNSYFFNLAFSRNGSSYSISAGDLDELRLVFIQSSTNTSGKSSSLNQLDKLYDDGIDLSDYYAVMDYFGLDS